MRALGLLIVGSMLVVASPSLAVATPPPVAIKTDIESVAQLIALAKATMLTDPKTAIDMATRAEKLLTNVRASNSSTEVRAELYWLKGEALFRLNDLQGAEESIAKGLRTIEVIRAPLKLRGDLLLSRGGINQTKVDVAKALNDFQSAYKIYKKLNENRSVSIALKSIAALYRQAGDQKSAIKYDSDATDIYPNDTSISISTLNNKGNSFHELGDERQAEEQYKKALVLAKKVGSATLTAIILRNSARAMLSANNLDGADRRIAEAFQLVNTKEGQSWRPQLLALAAQAALQRGDLAKATRLINESLATGESELRLQSHEVHETAYKIFSKIGRADLALPHLEALKQLDDKAAQLAASTNTALMAARFDFAAKDAKIAKLRTDELQRRITFEKSRARLQRNIFIGVVLTSLVGVGLLIFGLITIRRSRNEVRAANVDLAASNSALEKALAAKAEFLATTSHEVRTPLNGILGMTQVMLADQTLAPATRDRLSVVHGAGLTMRALVDDILDVAKMETGNLTLEAVPTDLPATLREVSRLWEEQARARGIGFVLELGACPAMIEGDPARLRQIVFNLLSNALKFTEAGSVTLRAEAMDGDRLRIAVSDTGIGIPADKQEVIFESFKQVDAGTTRKFGGTGLGLSICRNLARAMGGDIEVHSVVGEGSTFAVVLPLIAIDAPAEAEGGAAAGPGLIIVDRNPITRSMLRALLAPRAGEVGFAGSAEEVIAAVGKYPPTLILIDEATLRASEDAMGALAQIVSAAAGAKVALLWAAPDAEMRAQLMASGIDQLIAKPIGGAALVEMLYPAETIDGAGAIPALVSRAA